MSLSAIRLGQNFQLWKNGKPLKDMDEAQVAAKKIAAKLGITTYECLQHPGSNTLERVVRQMFQLPTVCHMITGEHLKAHRKLIAETPVHILEFLDAIPARKLFNHEQKLLENPQKLDIASLQD